MCSQHFVSNNKTFDHVASIEKDFMVDWYEMECQKINGVHSSAIFLCTWSIWVKPVGRFAATQNYDHTTIFMIF